MSADPDSIGLIAKIGGALAAAAAPIVWVHRKLEKKADKVDLQEHMKDVKSEFMLHRTYFAKVFDQMRDNEQRAQDRHERIMDRMDK